MSLLTRDKPPKGKGKLAKREGGHITGIKKALRESQSYPAAFGEAAADAFRQASAFANPCVLRTPSFLAPKKVKKKHLNKKPSASSQTSARIERGDSVCLDEDHKMHPSTHAHAQAPPRAHACARACAPLPRNAHTHAHMHAHASAHACAHVFTHACKSELPVPRKKHAPCIPPPPSPRSQADGGCIY